jgi:hypothetical protein
MPVRFMVSERSEGAARQSRRPESRAAVAPSASLRSGLVPRAGGETGLARKRGWSWGRSRVNAAGWLLLGSSGSFSGPPWLWLAWPSTAAAAAPRSAPHPQNSGDGPLARNLFDPRDPHWGVRPPVLGTSRREADHPLPPNGRTRQPASPLVAAEGGSAYTPVALLSQHPPMEKVALRD